MARTDYPHLPQHPCSKSWWHTEGIVSEEEFPRYPEVVEADQYGRPDGYLYGEWVPGYGWHIPNALIECRGCAWLEIQVTREGYCEDCDGMIAEWERINGY